MRVSRSRRQRIEWKGIATASFYIWDDLPTVTPSVDSEFIISPSKDLIVGQKIKFTVTTPYKGKIIREGELLFFSSSSADATQKVEQIRTIRRGNVYVTTGYFTPKKSGKYMPFYLNLMQDEKTKEQWEGVESYKFEVKESPNITASLSPNTAYRKAGEEIYLSVTYLSPDFPTQLITWNQKNIDQVIGAYDYAIGGFKCVYRFKPEKKGTSIAEN